MSRLSEPHWCAFILIALVLLFSSTGFSPASAQTVKQLEDGVASCEKNKESLNRQMQTPCKAHEAQRQTCDDTRAWLDNLKRIRANNPTPYQDSILQARAERRQKIDTKEKECNWTSANEWGNCSYMRDEAARSKIPGLYNAEACAKAREENTRCQGELNSLRNSGGVMEDYELSQDPVKKQAAEMEARIREEEKEYARCVEILQERENECRSLVGQYTSVATACDDLKQKLQAALRSGQGPSVQIPAAGTVRLAPVDKVEDKVDSPVNMKATVEVRGPVPSGTQLGYYWYVNQVFRTSGMNMNSYSFKVPNVGLKKVEVGVSVVYYDGAEKKWKPVGQATYDFGGGATGRTVKIGYINYQKLSGFTVSINGDSRDCKAIFDQSKPFKQGEGSCTFDVTPGPCSISVSASGYETVTFQHTCAKDETMLTTLTKKR